MSIEAAIILVFVLIGAAVIIAAWIAQEEYRYQMKLLAELYGKKECYLKPTDVYGDTTVCNYCGRMWDTNDPDPPTCPRRIPPMEVTPF